MKKILTILIGLMLLLPITSLAGAPSPKPFVAYVMFKGEPVVGLDVLFTCGGKTITKTTNIKGGVMVDIGGGSPEFKDVTCSILEVDCGYEACQKTYNAGAMDCPKCEYIYELGEAPPEPVPECLIDSDCSLNYKCISEKCVYVEPEPTPTPTPEPKIEEKVNSNEDGTIALIEANFGDCVDVVITDSKLSKLFDGTIDFDTEDYDTHEEISLKYCIETSLDDVDFGLEPKVIIEEESIEYCYVFDDLIPLADIARDEELEIEFLNDSLEIISLSNDRMTIRHGELYNEQDGCVEGEEIDYNGLPISIGTIGEDFVYLSYNGESERINYETVGEVGEIQIYVDEAVPNRDRPGLCSIRIAEDIEEAIDDGDEFVPGWDYKIIENRICITNSEEYKYLDEGNQPLSLGDKIELPNEFVVIKVNKISTSDVTEVDIKIRDDYFLVQGSRDDDQDDAFSYNNEDYDEVYVGAEGILDSDKVLITIGSIRIGESDVYLEQGSLIIGDLTIELNFLDILYKGISFANKDDNYLTYEGIIFKNPEDSVDGKGTFDVIVPDEVPELTVTIGLESETIGIEPEPTECPACTEEECIDTVCPSPAVCKTCPDIIPTECPPEKTCPPVTNNLAAIIITGILSMGGGAAIFFKLFNNKIFTSSRTGIKSYRGRDGTLKILHKHPGTTGYHDPQISHRAPETHPKGMIDVKEGYVKNEKGEWEYR
ncbi:hypothetical protein LCGC14_0598530 [marine sediment metagenome]|uniref:Uncharacterized protein n=1 Tax=marine sediment metagenome TaxID=412755 RepID=A0A0F9RV44_9ZZZZ